ncbi:phosphotransferase [Nocardioides sp. CER19]|uniref:maltokinase N-terminal cap-like domain-containing protein n=1 Tax=Nocardioides sp. CER19 TaxID=3038538 RepID=UPI0024498C6D|nr:phosphotransferase [Nocardioides sp. CER19]MDH2415431.1 phosphotransferase [Nocardioides sp. CER19]
MSVTAASADHLDREVFADYLSRTRWFGGKGRTFHVSDIRVLEEVPGRVEDSPHVLIHLVEVAYAEPGNGPSGEVELYQVPLAFYEHPQGRLDHAFIGWWEDPALGWVHAYDALHDREAMACWLRSFEAAAGPAGVPADGRLTFHRLPGHQLDTTAHSTLFSGEQSNSSVAFGEDALMKVFRKVTPGVNPDIEIHRTLTEVGSDHVAALYGWLEAESPAGDQPVMQLAMLQQFLRTATDGWDLALASVRSLLGSPELHATDSGGDFAGESARLGEAVADVHRQLAERFPPEARGPEAAAALAAAMNERLDRALAAVPDLAPHVERLRSVFARVAALGGLEVQRIHGDLHLGQTLRTAKGWKIVDFEGEPAKPLAERMLPDSRWRDVAGMLRSFDYAPRSVEHSQPGADSDSELAELRRMRADEWAHRNRNHFLVAYGGDLTVEQRVLLDAYVADKAVYETVYEARNRPGWLTIPLEALAQIGA